MRLLKRSRPQLRIAQLFSISGYQNESLSLAYTSDFKLVAAR
jgi:hypothetical protein